MDLANVFYSTLINKDNQKQGQQCTFTVSSQIHVNSPALRHNTALKHLEHFGISQNIILAIMMKIYTIRSGEQEVSHTSNVLIKHIHARRWKINPMKLQGTAKRVKCKQKNTHTHTNAIGLDFVRMSSCKVRDKLRPLSLPSTKKET